LGGKAKKAGMSGSPPRLVQKDGITFIGSIVVDGLKGASSFAERSALGDFFGFGDSP